MKLPILPVSAKTGRPQPLPAGTGILGFLQPVSWAPVGTTCPAGHSGWGFWDAQSLTLRRTRGLFPWCSLVCVRYLPLPTQGGGIYKYSEPFAFLSPSSLPPVLKLPKHVWGLRWLPDAGKQTSRFGEVGGTHFLAVTSSSWSSSSLPRIAFGSRSLPCHTPTPEC